MGNKLEILQLLENGSITAEEAERLLDTAEHEELEAFRQEMREQMAAIQNAAEDARCAARQTANGGSRIANPVKLIGNGGS